MNDTATEGTYLVNIELRDENRFLISDITATNMQKAVKHVKKNGWDVISVGHKTIYVRKS